MNAHEIRKKFLDYFEKHNHTVVPSSSLIPAEDPTLLFTNAGMNQFKDLFLGKEKRSYTRATSSQKCVRAGGKHNDLDQVGFTERHLTFFEMLGNFSFGDYFKKEAIEFAWGFLTKEMNLPIEKLYPSVFKDDNEAYDLWANHIGVSKERIIRLGEADNFWSMGDTGPCGPCTEIYIDRGEDTGCKQPGCLPGCDCARFTEIWNLVFMQFDRQPDGELKPLKAKGVDTGMGLERLCMVTQGKYNLYETDQFQVLIKEVETLTGISYENSTGQIKAAFNVLSDHVRSCSFLIADGCTPSNDGRGYVLRKIIRRAALFAQKLSDDLTLFPKLAAKLIQEMKDAFPELEKGKKLIINLLTSEIERFNQNLLQGQNIFENYLKENKKKGLDKLTGKQVFKLYDTYGFPPELTRVMTHERGFKLDMEGFDVEMQKQQEQSGKKIHKTEDELIIAENFTTDFKAYETTQLTSPISWVQHADDHVWIITKATPFYVESGGQVSDTGHVVINSVSYPVIELKKVGERFNPAIAVKLKCNKKTKADSEKIKVGDLAECIVDAQLRFDTVKNHTATHLLQAALLQVLGPQVKQAGSLVHPDYLRFDFTHHAAMTTEEIKRVEDSINAKIQENIKTNIFYTTLADAKNRGIISFFGEKYNPEEVRVVEIPGFSAELCGGTHADRTGIIGAFKITSDVALSTGVRRLVALTGTKAIECFQESFGIVKKLGEEFKSKPENIIDAVEKLKKQHQETLTQLKHLKKQLLKTQIPAWGYQIEMINDLPFLYLETEDLTLDDLRTIAHELEKIKHGFYFFLNKDGDRSSFLGYLSKNYEKVISLKQLSAYLKENDGLRGGGNAAMIQGGGGKIAASLKDTLVVWIKNQH